MDGQVSTAGQPRNTALRVYGPDSGPGLDVYVQQDDGREHPVMRIDTDDATGTGMLLSAAARGLGLRLDFIWCYADPCDHCSWCHTEAPELVIRHDEGARGLNGWRMGRACLDRVMALNGSPLDLPTPPYGRRL